MGGGVHVFQTYFYTHKMFINEAPCVTEYKSL